METETRSEKKISFLTCKKNGKLEWKKDVFGYFKFVQYSFNTNDRDKTKNDYKCGRRNLNIFKNTFETMVDAFKYRRENGLKAIWQQADVKIVHWT